MALNSSVKASSPKTCIIGAGCSGFTVDLSNLTSALLGMVTTALVTPGTLESADCTFLTQLTPQTIPETSREIFPSEIFGSATVVVWIFSNVLSLAASTLAAET